MEKLNAAQRDSQEKDQKFFRVPVIRKYVHTLN